MSFPQFAAAAAAAAAAAGLPSSVPQSSSSVPASSQMSAGSPPAPTTPRGCCENGRPVLTDPHTGQTVCSCQYSPTLLGYPRVPGLESMYTASAYAAAVSQGYMALGAEGSAFYTPLGSSPYDLKESAEAWRTLAAQPAFPYDPMSLYPYGAGYGGLDLNSRRKNATRENTNTLKAWLYEHRKNPYPTKGEKIMLAIITKMTLTQVSTWFANARRRLKKENKMTWSPRNRSEDGSEAGDNPEDVDVDPDGDGAGGDGGGGGGGGGGGSGGRGDDDVDVGPLSPERSGLGANGLTSPRPSTPLSHTDNDRDLKERIINVEDEEESCSSFKDHDFDNDDDLSAGEESSRRLIRDRSPLRGSRDKGEGGSSPSSSEKLLLEGERRTARGDEHSSRVLGLSSHLLRTVPVSGVGGGVGGMGARERDRDSAADPQGSSAPAPSSAPTSTRPKIWSVSEFLHPTSTSASSSSSSASVSSSSSTSSSNASQGSSSSQAAMMTAAARAAMMAAAGDARGPPGAFAGLRPSTLNTGYIYLPPGASAAWAAAGARFGHLGTYPLSLSHTTLSYPYSLSAHTPSKASLEASAAMRGLSVEALREAQLGVGGKLTGHGRPNGSLFSPARDIDGIRGPAVSSSRLVESNI